MLHIHGPRFLNPSPLVSSTKEAKTLRHCTSASQAVTEDTPAARTSCRPVCSRQTPCWVSGSVSVGRLWLGKAGKPQKSQLDS